MNEPIKTIQYKGHDIKIFYDEISESPRNWDNLGTMICFHRRYELGDKQDKINHDHYNSWNEIKSAIGEVYGDIGIILPLQLYDHSGITMYIGATHDRWDGGQVGYIFVTKDKLRKEYGVKRITKNILEKAEKILRSEIQTYDKYLRGEVYYFETEVDSCGGFYDMQDAIDEAESGIDYKVKQEQIEKENRLKQYIKNSVPLQYRFI